MVYICTQKTCHAPLTATIYLTYMIKKYLPTRYVSKFDIVCFMETKTDEVDLVSTLIPGYSLFLNNKKRKYCLCGGISVKN